MPNNREDKGYNHQIIEKGYKPSNEGYQPSLDIQSPTDYNPQSGYQPEQNSGNNPSNQPSAPGDE